MITNTFEEGPSGIIKTVLEGKEKPVLVSIHGFPHSGKTELRKRAAKALSDKGIYGLSGMEGDSVQKSGGIQNPGYFLIEDMPYTESADEYTMRLFGRKPDLKVLIMKKDKILPAGILECAEQGTYGLIIENELASRKNKY